VALDENYDPEWAHFEVEVLEITNGVREQGWTCGDEYFPPAPPVTMNQYLRTAARRHSWHQAEEGYLGHFSPGGPCGEDWVERCENANYVNWVVLGENCHGGSFTAFQAVNAWLNSPGHCATLMNPEYEHLGVGYAYEPTDSGVGDYLRVWTQNFGAEY
jgi:uncharacterized protein YkwD